MEHGTLKAVYVVGENPAQSEADKQRAVAPARRARPPRRAGPLPDADGGARRRRPPRLRRLGGVGGHGHLERASRAARAQGARPAGRGARRHRDRLRARAAPRPRPRQHEGRGHLERGALALADARGHELRAARGARAASSGRAGTTSTPASSSSTVGCGTRSVVEPAPFMAVEHSPPVDVLDDEFPLRLTTGRRLESFNTGVQTGRFSSPLHVDGEALRVSPEDGARYGLVDGGRARRRARGAARSRRRWRSTRRCGRGSRS